MYTHTYIIHTHTHIYIDVNKSSKPERVTLPVIKAHMLGTKLHTTGGAIKFKALAIAFIHEKSQDALGNRRVRTVA